MSHLYPDGSCLMNPGPGGYCCVVVDDSSAEPVIICGNDKQTTNNQMELKAAIKGLEHLKSKGIKECEVTTDSMYVKNGITTWIKNWKKNNWKNAQRKPVKNQELWKELDTLVENMQVKWNWVKGHSGHEYNEMADKVALQEAHKAKNEVPPSPVKRKFIDEQPFPSPKKAKKELE